MCIVAATQSNNNVEYCQMVVVDTAQQYSQSIRGAVHLISE